MFKAWLESLDGLSDEEKTLYTENTLDKGGKKGGYIIAIENANGYGLADVKKLTTALGSERETTAKLTRELAPYYDDDEQLLDPVAAREAMNRKPDDNVDVDALVADRLDAVKKRHEIERTELQNRGDSFQSELHDLVMQNDLRTALTNDNDDRTLPRSVDGILPLMRQFCGVEIVDGERRTVVYEKDGKTHRINGNGETMSAQELVDSIRDDDAYKGMFHDKKQLTSANPRPNRPSILEGDRPLTNPTNLMQVARGG